MLCCTVKVRVGGGGCGRAREGIFGRLFRIKMHINCVCVIVLWGMCVYCVYILVTKPFRIIGSSHMCAFFIRVMFFFTSTRSTPLPLYMHLGTCTEKGENKKCREKSSVKSARAGIDPDDRHRSRMYFIHINTHNAHIYRRCASFGRLNYFMTVMIPYAYKDEVYTHTHTHAYFVHNIHKHYTV